MGIIRAKLLENKPCKSYRAEVCWVLLLRMTATQQTGGRNALALFPFFKDHIFAKCIFTDISPIRLNPRYRGFSLNADAIFAVDGVFQFGKVLVKLESKLNTF